MDPTRGLHWDDVYASRPVDAVSWFQAEPATSLRLLTDHAPDRGSVLDVGAGASALPAALVGAGWAHVTVLDVSARALDFVRRSLPDGAVDRGVSLVRADVLEWQPPHTYAAWHDRAVFHFLVAAEDRRRYAAAAARSVVPGGVAVIGTFAVDGPTSCAGLPTTRYDAAGLAAELGDPFTLEHAEREEHVTPAGHVQPFTWPVLRRGRTR